MLLSRARRSYDSGPPTPPSPTFGVDDGDDEQNDSSCLKRRHSDHHRSASSSDVTPRPKPSVFRSGPFLALPTLHHEHDRRRQQHEALLDADSCSDFDGFAPHARHDLNINILSSDPFLAAPPQSSRRLGFFTASNSTSNPRNTSPSPSQHLKPNDLSHSYPRTEAAAPQCPIMASVASSNTLKSHTSPSKPSSTRTYDAKLVSREMHRLGTLAGLNPSIAPSLSTGPVAPPLTLTPSTSPSSSGIASTLTIHSSASSVGITDKDNPWRTLHVHVLPLFNEEPLRVPIEDLNALVRRHIQTVLAVSPSKTLAALETDARELIAAGMVTLNAKLSNISDEILLGRVIEIWAFFWDQILPYIEGVLLPLQTDPLLTSLHRTQKQHRSSSPTRQGSKISGSSALSSLSPTIDVRSVALCAFRDRVVLPIHGRLQNLLSPPFGKDMLARLSPFRQPRLQQMLLVLTSERRVRSPSPPLSLHTPVIQPSAGEAAIESLLRLVSNPQRLSHGYCLAPRAATPSFLSAGRPRDRRGRIGSSGAASVLGIVGGWATIPVQTDEREEEEEEGGETPKIGGIDKGLAKPYHQRGGGWGLGAGNEDIIRPVEEDDDDEALDWDQAQAVVEKMVGIKPIEAVADSRKRAT